MAAFSRGEAMGASGLRELAARCLQQVEAQPRPFRPRSLLAPPLQRFQELADAGTLDELEGRCASGASPASARCRARLLVVALADALRSCLLVLAVLADRRTGRGGPLPREAALWPGSALRCQGQRLECIVQAIASLPDVLGGVAGAWERTELLAHNALAALWARHFPGQTAASVDALLDAMSAAYDPLSEEEREAIRPWLHPDADGMVCLLDADAVLGARGPWRGTLFCTSCAELCPELVLQVVMAGGRDRHVAMTVADIADEDRTTRRTALFAGWSRASLVDCPLALRALNVLGMQAALDAGDAGLTVQLAFADVAECLRCEASAVSACLRDHLPPALAARPPVADAPAPPGGGGPGVAQPPPTGAASIVALVGGHATRAWNIADERSRHTVLTRIHQRSRFKLRDDTAHMVGLQRRHQALVSVRTLELNGAAAGDMQPAASVFPAGGPQYTVWRPKLRDLTNESRSVFRQTQQHIWEALEADVRRNAELSVDAPMEPQLKMIQDDAAFADRELELLFDINLCMAQQIAARQDMSRMKVSLARLEAGFDRTRRRLTLRELDLSRRIATAEEELATLSAGLASKREAARCAADAAADARLLLAEAMVPLPAVAGGGALEALEERISLEGQALKQRVEELQKRYSKAKAAAKKR